MVNGTREVIAKWFFFSRKRKKLLYETVAIGKILVGNYFHKKLWKQNCGEKENNSCTQRCARCALNF